VITYRAPNRRGAMGARPCLGGFRSSLDWFDQMAKHWTGGIWITEEGLLNELNLNPAGIRPIRRFSE